MNHQAEELWLGPGSLDADLLHDLLQPYPDGRLHIYRVSDKVNKPGNNLDQALIYELPAN